MNKWTAAFFDLLFPRCCVVCGCVLSANEKYLCIKCLTHLPKTNDYLKVGNNTEKRFWGKFQLERAAAYFYYEKGSDFDKILYELKYHGCKEIGATMGRYLATEMLLSGFFDGIDLIIPVPLHPDKEKKRGYNQSAWIAKGVSEVTGIRLEANAVARLVDTNTQTRKSVFERWENVQDIFSVVSSDFLERKHILLVDDVVTTGSTLYSCATAVVGIKGVKISILTLAAV